jgi:hypothetical protein
LRGLAVLFAEKYMLNDPAETPTSMEVFKS